MNKALLWSFIACLSACSGDDNHKDKSENVTVYKGAVNQLCGSRVGELYGESERRLIEQGIDVLSSSCAHVLTETGTLDCEHFERVNIHTVRATNLEDVAQLGYDEVSSIEQIYNLSLSDSDCRW